MNGWGMIKTNSVYGIGTLTAGVSALGEDERVRQKRKSGRGLWGVELKHVGSDGRTLALDGISPGELLVRGPWVTAGYFGDASASQYFV